MTKGVALKEEQLFLRVPLFRVEYADLLVIACVDHRFREANQKAVENFFGTNNLDYYALPGAVRFMLAEPLLLQLLLKPIKEISLGKHQVQEIVLVGHWDCGGYGGSKAFANPQAEELVYRRDLLTLANRLAKELDSGVRINAIYSRPEPSQGQDYFSFQFVNDEAIAGLQELA